MELRRSNRYRLGLVPGAVLVVMLGATACGSDSEPGAAPSPAGASSTAAPPTEVQPTREPTASAVPAVLDFTASTVGGEEFSGATAAGKPVVLWFWAPWCAVCRSQASFVESLVADYGQDLSVIGVGSLDSGSAIASFAKDVAGPVHLSDPDGDLWKRFRIAEQSSFVVLDAAGREVLRTGYNDDDGVDAAIKSLVG